MDGDQTAKINISKLLGPWTEARGQLAYFDIRCGSREAVGGAEIDRVREKAVEFTW